MTIVGSCKARLNSARLQSYPSPGVQDASRPRAELSSPDYTISTPGSNANLLSPE